MIIISCGPCKCYCKIAGRPVSCLRCNKWKRRRHDRHNLRKRLVL